jgi:D-alanyl-lipoteichoic acid acyltransferase DltB (MBOAT superfamily)
VSFASLEFLPFLALVVGLFVYVPRSSRRLFLLAASYAFYLQAEPWHGLLLVGSTVVDYLVGLALGQTDSRRRRKVLLGASLVLNLGALAFFKYSGFIVENLQFLLGETASSSNPWLGLVLPLGISFYTFQTLAYTIDVYRGTIQPCRSFVSFALYVSFFPQLIAGPIERAGHLIPQLESAQVISLARLRAGGGLILWGLLKKLLCAEHLVRHVKPVFDSPGEQGSLTLVLAAVGMNVVLFLDFSAYTDIARGAARLFGIDLVDNFRRPFLSRSVGEFATRWHISLFRWISDYVYSPLSTGALSHWKLWRNNCLAMGLFGLWHGSSWTFILWGIASGVAISMQHSLRLLRARSGRRRELRTRWGLRDMAACLGTTLFTSAFIVFFFSPDLDFALGWYARLLSLSGDSNPAWMGWTLLALCCGLAVQAAGEFGRLEGAWRRIGWPGRAIAVVASLAALVYLRIPEAADFIYFRF